MKHQADAHGKRTFNSQRSDERNNWIDRGSRTAAAPLTCIYALASTENTSSSRITVLSGRTKGGEHNFPIGCSKRGLKASLVRRTSVR